MKTFTMKIFTIAHLFVWYVKGEASSGAEGEEWRNVGDCGEGLACDPACQLKCLEMHNYYRSLHSSPPLKCDPGLARSAQDWADAQARDKTMSRSEWTEKFTELISYKGEGWPGMNQTNTAVAGAVRSWYSEVKNSYDYESGRSQNGGIVGHFQAVVWENVAKLGCGVNVASGDGTYVTARSFPPSHVDIGDDKAARENVLPRRSPDAECNQTSGTRELCDEGSTAPEVTPRECIDKGCCYDDVFMSEPSVTYYSQQGRMWCFKRKN